MNPAHWQISAGTLAEAWRPAGFVLAAVVSAWVLSDALRRRLGVFAVSAWTLLNLFFAPVVLPLYLIARRSTRRKYPATESGDAMPPAAETIAESSGASAATAATDALMEDAWSARRRPRWPLALPPLYLLLLILPGALYFYLDYESVDAHLARASQAKIVGRHERAIGEYRAALALEDDAHTRKLLGIELDGAGRTPEALDAYRAAARGGEPDELLPFRIAAALDALGRATEAAPAYQNFLQSRLCARRSADSRCGQAQGRLQTLSIPSVATPPR